MKKGIFTKSSSDLCLIALDWVTIFYFVVFDCVVCRVAVLLDCINSYCGPE